MPPAARFAAKELQRYVEKATGVVLPIVDQTVIVILQALL
mgnify:CR=1 FL=1